MIHLAFLIALLAASAAASLSLTENAAEVWRKYSKLFGKQLGDTFSSAYTLENFDERQSAAAEAEESGIIIGCTETYYGGEVFAREAWPITSHTDENAPPSLKPLSVMLEEDYMCFLAIDGDKKELSPLLKESLEFEMYYPPALKIHPSVYNMLETLQNIDAKASGDAEQARALRVEAFKNVDLSFSYQTEFFYDGSGGGPGSITSSANARGEYYDDYSGPGEDFPTDDDPLSQSPPTLPVLRLSVDAQLMAAAEKHFRTNLALLNATSAVTTFATDFYWTSKDTAIFFRDAQPPIASDAEFNEDNAKHRFLSEIAKQAPQDAKTEGGDSADFCGFQAMVEKSEFFAVGTIRLSISELLTAPQGEADHDSTAFCLLYLAASLSAAREVQFVTTSDRPLPLNYRGRSICQTANKGAAAENNIFTAFGLNGVSQLVGVCDTGLDENVCYFYDKNGAVPRTPWSSSQNPTTQLYRYKVVQYIIGPTGDGADIKQGHGTHVSGSIVGKIPSVSIFTDPAGKFDGVAPLAKITFFDASTAEGLGIPGAGSLYGPGYSAGTRVFSNSWGSYFPSSGGYYTGADTDKWLYDNPMAAIFMAAGNGGSNGAGSITMSCSSKNVIAVCASESLAEDGQTSSQNIGWVAYFSSQGPTNDQRIKPDLCAPGAVINSAASSGTSSQSCSLTVKQGTSMATPVASGQALLVRQYFMDNEPTSPKYWQAICDPNYKACGINGVRNKNGFEPSGALVKAVLLHGAAGMTMFDGTPKKTLGVWPDSYQGWGRILLKNVLKLAQRPALGPFDLFVADRVLISAHATVTYRINYQGSSTPLTATLVWYDPPAVEGSTARSLISDLDLCAISPSTVVTCGNTRSSTADRVNNNEKLLINSPQAGVWQVTVKANALPYGSGQQYFSIVITSQGGVTRSG